MKKETEHAAVNELAAALLKNLPEEFLNTFDTDALTTIVQERAKDLLDALVKSIKLPKSRKDWCAKHIAMWQIEVAVATMFAYQRLRQFGICDRTANQIIREVSGVA